MKGLGTIYKMYIKKKLGDNSLDRASHTFLVQSAFRALNGILFSKLHKQSFIESQ